MNTLGVEEARSWLQEKRGQQVYLHMEDNPIGYLRNAAVQLKDGHIHGVDLYRVYLEWTNPNGIVQLNDVTDFCIDDDALVCTAYDSQSRISHSLEIRDRPFTF